jgi:hypothetical protein
MGWQWLPPCHEDNPFPFPRFIEVVAKIYWPRRTEWSAVPWCLSAVAWQMTRQTSRTRHSFPSLWIGWNTLLVHGHVSMVCTQCKRRFDSNDAEVLLAIRHMPRDHPVETKYALSSKELSPESKMPLSFLHPLWWLMAMVNYATTLQLPKQRLTYSDWRSITHTSGWLQECPVEDYVGKN